MARKKMQNEQYELLKKVYLWRVIPYYPDFKEISGSIQSAIMLAQLCYWSGAKNVAVRGGWLYKTVQQFLDEAGLSKKQQYIARKRLETIGVIECKLKGIPRRWWYRVNFEVLEALLQDVEEKRDRDKENSGWALLGSNMDPEGDPLQVL